MAKKEATANFPGALAESIKSSIHALEVQINLLKQVIGAAPASAAAAAKPAKGKKAKDEEEEIEDPIEDDEEEVEEDEEDDAEDDEEEEESEDEDEEEESEDEDDAEETLTHKDVLKAFKNYSAAKPGNRDKALKLLAKYKVEAVKDLKAKDFPAVMKALK